MKKVALKIRKKIIMIRLNFNTAFEYILSPLLPTFADDGLMEEVRGLFKTLDEGFSVYFNPYGVLYNPSAGQEFKDSVAAGKFTFSADEVARLRRVSEYPPSAELPLYSTGIPPTRHILVDEVSGSTAMADLDRKFMYTIMLASAGRLCQAPENPDTPEDPFVPPALTFSDRRIILYYDNSKLESVPKSDTPIPIGRFEAILYVRRTEKGTGPQWDVMYGRIPVWTSGADKFVEHINMWSTMDNNLGKAELEKILTSRFSNVTSNSLHISQDVNFTLDAYGEILKMYHFLGNVVESGSYPSQVSQWGQTVADMQKKMKVDVSRIGGEAMTTAMLYYFKCISITPFRDVASWMSSTVVRPVEASQQTLAEMTRQLSATESVASLPEPTSSIKISPSDFLKKVNVEAVGINTGETLLESGSSRQYYLFKSPVASKPAASVTLEEKKNYALWVCGMMLASVLYPVPQTPNVSDGASAKRLADKIFQTLVDDFRAAIGDMRWKRLDKKAANEAGMGLMHTLFWTFSSQNATFRDLQVAPFQLDPNTEMQWVASLLENGMQAFVDTNTVKAMAMHAEYNDNKDVVRFVKKDWLRPEIKSDNLFDMLAYDLTANRDNWEIASGSWDMIMNRRSGGNVFEKENRFVKLIAAVRCCVPIMYMVWRITSDAKMPGFGPKAHFFLDEITMTQKSHFGAKTSGASVHPAFAYLTPTVISGIPVVEMGKAALIFVGTLFSKEAAAGESGWRASVVSAVSAFNFIVGKKGKGAKDDDDEYSTDEEEDKGVEKPQESKEVQKSSEVNKDETVVVCVERSAANFAKRMADLVKGGSKRPSAPKTTRPVQATQTAPKKKKTTKAPEAPETPEPVPPQKDSGGGEPTVRSSRVSTTVDLKRYTVILTNDFNALFSYAGRAQEGAQFALSMMNDTTAQMSDAIENKNFDEQTLRALEIGVEFAIDGIEKALAKTREVNSGLLEADKESEKLKKNWEHVPITSETNKKTERLPPLFKGEQVRRLTTITI